MAGHSKFKNIQHRKGAQDKKRAKLFTKLVKEIIVATKSGQADPSMNPRLRTALIAARSQNLPKDRIDKAISQASGSGSDASNYDEIRYEGFAPGGIAIIVEAMTDNRNRTASDVRSSFTKYGGNLGETGSVSFMFDKLGIIEYSASNIKFDDLFEYAAEIGVENIESEEDSYVIYTLIEDFSSVLDLMSKKFGDPSESKIGWRPKNLIMIDDLEKAQKLIKLIDLLEDSDDVQYVFSNYEFTEEIYKAMSEE